MTTGADGYDNPGMRFQVYEVCEVCEFLHVPVRELTAEEVRVARPCPARCGGQVEAVVLRGRRPQSTQDLARQFYDVLRDSLTGGDAHSTAELLQAFGLFGISDITSE
jgi:hypothetical protein